jgi:nucleoside-diphosphate kinase
MFYRTSLRFINAAKRSVAPSRFMHAARSASGFQFSASSSSSVMVAVAASAAVMTFGFVSSEAHAHTQSVNVPHFGAPGTKHERTFIAIKPDGVQRGLVSEVIARFEKKGYKLVAMKMMTASEARAREHYADLSARPFFPGLVKYFTSGPIVCMVWEGTDVILTGRKILGATNPNAAVPGTLRGDNCISTGRNLVHGSDGAVSAKHEISMWFKPEEISNYERALDSWIVADN